MQEEEKLFLWVKRNAFNLHFNLESHKTEVLLDLFLVLGARRVVLEKKVCSSS